MATSITATCHTCGEIKLDPDDIELRICNFAPSSTYGFECPGCQDMVVKPADDRVVQLLISGGVQAVVWDYPLEAVEVHTGPPISYNDLIDFHFELEERSSVWFARLCALDI